MTDEEKKVLNFLENQKNWVDCGFKTRVNIRRAIGIIINQQALIEKQQKEIERNKENWLLAQNEILGYAQGYEDGKKHQQTATAMVVENRQYQMIAEEIKRYKAIIEKQQNEIEELIYKFKKGE